MDKTLFVRRQRRGAQGLRRNRQPTNGSWMKEAKRHIIDQLCLLETEL
jgi:hypothetical protein